MTGMPPESPSRDHRAWAVRQLGLEVDASPAEVRAAFVRQLRQADFLPTPALQQAYRLLTATGATEQAAGVLPEHALCEIEETLREEAEGLASVFFRIPVGERRQRWQELRDRCTSCAPLTARLMALEPGLEVDLGAVAGAGTTVGELAEVIGTLFTSRPANRAMIRQEWLAGIGPRLGEWEQAARQLQGRHPEAAKLDGELISLVFLQRKLRKQIDRSRKRRQQCLKAWQAPQKSSSAWVALVLIGIVSAALRAGLSGPSRTSSIPDHTPPRFQMPSTDWARILEDLERAKPADNLFRKDAAVNPLFPPDFLNPGLLVVDHATEAGLRNLVEEACRDGAGVEAIARRQRDLEQWQEQQHLRSEVLVDRDPFHHAKKLGLRFWYVAPGQAKPPPWLSTLEPVAAGKLESARPSPEPGLGKPGTAAMLMAAWAQAKPTPPPADLRPWLQPKPSLYGVDRPEVPVPAGPVP